MHRIQPNAGGSVTSRGIAGGRATQEGRGSRLGGEKTTKASLLPKKTRPPEGEQPSNRPCCPSKVQTSGAARRAREKTVERQGKDGVKKAKERETPRRAGSREFLAWRNALDRVSPKRCQKRPRRRKRPKVVHRQKRRGAYRRRRLRRLSNRRTFAEASTREPRKGLRSTRGAWSSTCGGSGLPLLWPLEERSLCNFFRRSMAGVGRLFSTAEVLYSIGCLGQDQPHRSLVGLGRRGAEE